MVMITGKHAGRIDIVVRLKFCFNIHNTNSNFAVHTMHTNFSLAFSTQNVIWTRSNSEFATLCNHKHNRDSDV